MIQLTTYNLGGGAPAERVFAAKPVGLVHIVLLLGALAAGGLALWLGFDPEAHTLIRAAPDVGREVAWIVGGVAALVAAGVCWEWYRGLRWVAVGRDGIRWLQGRRLHTRAWNEVTRLQHNIVKVLQDEKH